MPFFYALEVIFMENNIKINSTKRLTLSALVIALLCSYNVLYTIFCFWAISNKDCHNNIFFTYIFPFLVLHRLLQYKYLTQ